MQIVTTQYPTPPFEKQNQDESGLEDKMAPKPDYGKESYQGNQRLFGRKGHTILGDIREEGFCQSLVNKATQHLGCLDILMKNADKHQAPTGLHFKFVDAIPQFGSDTPLGRPGQPAEIASLYVTLAENGTGFSSGQIWCSDGGIVML